MNTEKESSNAPPLREDLELLKFGLAQERLRLEQQRSRLDTTLLAKHFPALLSAAIAFVGIVLSATNIWVAYVTKSKDVDIATRKDLRDFVAQHRAVIFGTDRQAAEQIRNTMRVTFPDELLVAVWPQIVVNAPATTRDLFSSTTLTARTFRGRVGIWGGPLDAHSTPAEDLAVIRPTDLLQFAQYFLPEQPPGTTGLTRRLNPESFYMSARWNYKDTNLEYLKTHKVKVTNPKNGKSAEAQPVDWGPAEWTGRVADISPGLAKHLALQIDDEVAIAIQ
jgi:hypothetical protein